MYHLLSFFRAKIYILSCLEVELCTPLPLTAPFLIEGSLCSDVVCLDVPLVLSCSLPQWLAPGPPTHCLRSAQPSSSPASHHRAERPTLKTKESLMENRLVWEGQAGRGGGRRFLRNPHFCSSLKALLARGPAFFSLLLCHLLAALGPRPTLRLASCGAPMRTGPRWRGSATPCHFRPPTHPPSAPPLPSGGPGILPKGAPAHPPECALPAQSPRGDV